MNTTTPDSTVSSQPAETRFERRLAKILEQATDIFCEKGYEGASMRDLSRSSGMSLAGLYYYFESKEKLLYLIQKHYFSTVMTLLRERLEGVTGAEERLRTFIVNHLEYFLSSPAAMKVLSHEDDVLEDNLGSEIRAIKRDYYHSCTTLVDELKKEKSLEFNTRIAVLSLFGTMNWLHTWYKPQVDGSPCMLARQIGDVFLRGIYSTSTKP